jgi:AdoMet-dependent rRNA methyltransferase SPB1
MPSGSIVLGVDLLPIRAIRNVKTLVADITTTECRKQITSELHGWKADVVLCDGAPNIGSAYQKDAYVQNELVIAALKVATEHLIEGGTFCTKVYRSKDYNSVLWVLQQLFVDVQAMKPNSSRSQSAEIFLVCLKYLNPTTIDPKLLDPNHVFKEVTDPNGGTSGSSKVDVLHKKYELHNKRHRSGYDDDAGVLLKKTCTVTQFVQSKDPVRLLTDMNEFIYTPECQELFSSHKGTNEDILLSFKDLRVLGRIDFKKLLRWRLLMNRDVLNPSKGVGSTASTGEGEGGEEVQVTTTERKGKRTEPLTEEEIQEEILKRRESIERLKRKEKKRARELAAKGRARQALGMNNNSFGFDGEVELFKLDDDVERQDLSGVDDIDLEELESDFDANSDDENREAGPDTSLIELADDDLEHELEQNYLLYASRGRSRQLKNGQGKHDLEDEIREGLLDRTVTAKKARLANSSEKKILKRQQDDAEEEDGEGEIVNLEEEIKGYVAMLNRKTGNGEDDDDDSSDDDDEEEEVRPRKKQAVDIGVPGRGKVNTRDELSVSSKATKWFSNPIFGESVVSASSVGGAGEEGEFSVVRAADDDENENNSDDEERIFQDLNLPLTDKQIRQMKRKKDMEKKKKKEEKRQQKRNALDAEHGGMFSMGIEVQPADAAEDEEEIDFETAKVRDLIRRGLGKSIHEVEKNRNTQFEIAPATEMSSRKGTGAGAESDDDGDYEDEDENDDPLSIGRRVDDRTYASDEEIYDNHDKATTLALGTMMLRNSRKKALVDASYNRFAWNDPKELPSWFIDDELRHNRPQLPVPNALLDHVKGKFQKSGSHEIKKVAEARMRKRKRAMSKLKAAKAQAKTFAENPDLSDKQKIKVTPPHPSSAESLSPPPLLSRRSKRQ